MRDRHGNDWTLPGDPLESERCTAPDCPARSRLGSPLCFDHHRGPPLWSDRHGSWLPPARRLHWCSLTDSRELVLL